MPEPRTDRIDVFVPRRLNDHERVSFIERHVEAELAKTGEWPERLDFASGFAMTGRPDVTRWSVTYTTGPFGHQTY
jgi:hypothetical protein